MYKKFNVIMLAVLAFGIGYSLNNIAASNTNMKIAVIDTAKIVANSSEVKSIKAEQQAKMKEIEQILVKAQSEISKETDTTKAAKLEEKYREEINKQKLALDTSYNQKISALNTKIHTAAENKAKSMNYDLVLLKDTVFWGGDDITNEVEKEIK